MARVKFYKINNSVLSSLPIAEGQIIFVQDKGKLYIDKDNSTRIQIEGLDLSAGDGISVNGTTVTNSGVRSISEGSSNGTISVNTNGTSADVSVHGLGSMAYKSNVTTSDITSGTLGVARGGTGASSLTSGQVLIGNGTNAVTTRAIDTTNGGTSSSSSLITSGAVYSGLSGKLDTTLKGANNGLAELDSNGKVPSTQLPSYVDDVIEGYFYNSKFYKEAAHTTEITGETGKIYVDLSTEKTYRWSGSAFVVISETLALGETDSTAYRGDRGKTAYDHSQLTSGNPHNVTKSDVGLGNVGNFKAVSTVASQGLSSDEQSNARANIGAGTSSLTLGTSSSDAYRGDYGDTAYGHATDTNRLTTAKTEGLYKIATTAEGHIKSVTAVTKSDITGLGIPGSDTDTKNTAGSTDSSSKLFLIGATSQAANPQTYSQDTIYAGTDGHLYSNSKQVVNLSDTQALTNKTYNGYTLADASAKGVDTSIAAASTSVNLPTSAAVASFVESKGYTTDTQNVFYGTCDTAATTQAKVVTCDGFTLTTGNIIYVKFTNAQTYNGTATLNVNSTGAKNITRVGTTTTTRYYWTAGEVVAFVYDGTNYVMENKGTASTTYYGLTKLSDSTNSTSTSLAATANAVKTAYDLANGKIAASDITITQTQTSGAEVGKIQVGSNAAVTLYAPQPGAVDTQLSTPNQTYYLTGIQDVAASSGSQIYNTRMSNTFTGIKYQTSTSSAGGSLYVDDREVTLGLHYEIA